MNIPPTPTKDLKKVPNGCAGRASDKSDFSRNPRQGLFVLFFEKPLSLKPFEELLERQLQGAKSLGDHITDDQLVGSARRINVDVTAADDLESVFEIKLESTRNAPPNRSLKYRPLVFQSHVEVAGSWFGKIRNLSGNPNRLKLLVQLLLNVLSQFGHTQRSIRIAIAHTLVLHDDIGGAESLQDACASFEFQRSHIPPAHAMGDHPSATPSMIRDP